MKKRERLAQMVAVLGMQGRTTGETLAEKLGVPATTVYSDIKTLRRSGIPIHGEPGPGGGFYLRPDHTRADLKLAPRDAALLMIAAGMLLARIPTPTGAAAIRTALTSACADLPKPLLEICAAVADLRLAPPDTPDFSLYSDLPELLTHATRNKLLLKITLAGDNGRSETLTGTPEAVQWGARGWKLVVRALPSGRRTELSLKAIAAARLVDGLSSRRASSKLKRPKKASGAR